jgi:hypothetical protein
MNAAFYGFKEHSLAIGEYGSPNPPALQYVRCPRSVTALLDELDSKTRRSILEVLRILPKQLLREALHGKQNESAQP